MSKVLEIQNLSFSYMEGVPVLDQVSLEVRQGELVMLMGPNGCGKTTLMKAILGLLPTNPPGILVQGRDQSAYTAQELAREISYVPQSSSSVRCDYSLREFLLMGRAPHIGLFCLPGQEDYELVLQYAEECGIAPLLDAPVSHLSGGQYQLATIARALVQGSKLIIMDEPLSALDLCNQARMLELLLKLQQKEKTILLSTHDPNHALAVNCTVYGFLNHGIAFCGQAERVLTPAHIAAIYGNKVALYECREGKHITFRFPRILE